MKSSKEPQTNNAVNEEEVKRMPKSWLVLRRIYLEKKDELYEEE